MLWDSYFEDICFGSCTVVNGHVIINLIICVVFNSSYMFISYFFCIVFGFILDKHFCTKLRKHYYVSDVMREGNDDAICVRALFRWISWREVRFYLLLREVCKCALLSVV